MRAPAICLPFDAQELRAAGAPLPVLQGVATDVATGAASFATASDGTLVYVPGMREEANRILVWADRQGNFTPLPLPARAYLYPRLSPDGRQIAFTVGSGTGNNDDIWIYDLAKNKATRLTFDQLSYQAVWSPDGKRVAYRSVGGSGLDRFNLQAADGTAPPETIYSSDTKDRPEAFTPDGEHLLFWHLSETTQGDIWSLPVKGERKPQPVVQTKADETGPALSPDGRWLAYGGEEGNRVEIFVQPFPGSGVKWQVSTEGGSTPVWSRDGKEIFFTYNGRYYAAAVQLKPLFSAGTPRLLFQSFAILPAPNPTRNYDVSPDGRHFLMVKKEGVSLTRKIEVVLNWPRELRSEAGNPK